MFHNIVGAIEKIRIKMGGDPSIKSDSVAKALYNLSDVVITPRMIIDFVQDSVQHSSGGATNLAYNEGLKITKSEHGNYTEVDADFETIIGMIQNGKSFVFYDSENNHLSTAIVSARYVGVPGQGTTYYINIAYPDEGGVMSIINYTSNDKKGPFLEAVVAPGSGAVTPGGGNISL